MPYNDYAEGAWHNGTGWWHNGTTWHNGTGTRTKFTPKLVDMTCGAMARHMGRVVGWYTAVSAATNNPARRSARFCSSDPRAVLVTGWLHGRVWPLPHKRTALPLVRPQHTQ